MKHIIRVALMTALILDPPCVKNATKTKIDLLAHRLAGFSLFALNNAFYEFVALSHELQNEQKWNPLKSRLIRGFLARPTRFERAAYRVGAV